jgi:hypothetical protein
MKILIPRKTPSKSPADRGGESVRMSLEFASQLAAEETCLIMESDRVGMEQLVAAFTRIPIPRRRIKTSKSAT